VSVAERLHCLHKLGNLSIHRLQCTCTYRFNWSH